jgi:hypothetical protein
LIVDLFAISLGFSSGILKPKNYELQSFSFRAHDDQSSACCVYFRANFLSLNSNPFNFLAMIHIWYAIAIIIMLMVMIVQYSKIEKLQNDAAEEVDMTCEMIKDNLFLTKKIELLAFDRKACQQCKADHMKYENTLKSKIRKRNAKGQFIRG